MKVWAEDKTSELLKLAGQTHPPLELSEKVLRIRKIKKVRYKPGLPERGRLATEDNGFSVELSPTKKYPAPWSRLSLSHEIAHTFLYNIENWPPLPLIHTEPGNPDVEWLCGYLSKCLLVPAEWLRSQIEHYPGLISQDFSLDVLYQLEKTFLVPWQVVAERLVEDLGLWNCIILHFVKVSEVGKYAEGTPIWRLNWYTVPIGVNKGLFIPVGRRIEGIMKFPRARGTLAQFIVKSTERGRNEPLFSQRIKYGVLSSGATGNLGKFLHKHSGSDELRVHCAVGPLSATSLFDRGRNQEDASIMVMCFPL
ncbi:MAG: hypothetical protein ABR911_14385 [Syntrophales bacterium]